MGNPFRRIESPASTALQVIEAHRLFHLVTVIVHEFIANKETLVFLHYWICCIRSPSELAWCARNKRPCELQKKIFAVFAILIRNFGILVPNLGEVHKF